MKLTIIICQEQCLIFSILVVSNMQFLIISSTLALFFLLGAVDARYVPGIYNLQDNVISTIMVDPNGLGNFTSVQQAIDSVAPNNTAWTRIHINYGIYR